MLAYEQEITDLKIQIEGTFKPQGIYVFGSCAMGVARKNSDIDLCIIMETLDERKMISEMLLALDYNRDFDIVIYTPQEWEKYHNDSTSFAYLINRTGVKILG